MRTALDGTLWLFTGHSISRLNDGEWITHPVTRGVPVGFDGAGRVWWVSEKGDTISAWNGDAWTTFGADSGWVKAQPDSGARFREGVTTDKRGVVWLTTSVDVHAFDGQRWTLYTGDQLGFTPTQAMIEEGTSYWLTDVVADGEGDVWVADCAWIGESSDGHGARWFTGQEWQGQNSRVVASGCVNDIEVDSAGRIWVGLDGDLWRYTPGQGWDQFPHPPVDPNGQLRWGFVHAVVLDPTGVPWVTIQRCGGATCETREFALFKVAGDTWTHILELPGSSPGDIAFDAVGNAWLCAGEGLYYITPQTLEQIAPDEIGGCSVEADSAGQVWLAMWGQSRLWLYHNPSTTN